MKERLIGAIVLVTVAWLLIPVFLDSDPGESDEMTTRTVELPGVAQEPGAQPMQTRTIDLRERGDISQPVVNDEPEVALQLPTPVTVIAKDEPAEVTGAELAEQASDASTQDAVSSDAEASASDGPKTPPETDERETVDPAQLLSEPVERPVPPDATRSDPLPEPSVSRSSEAANLWVVQVGSFGARANAERLMQSLVDEGFPAFVSEVTADGRTMHRVRVGPQKDRSASNEMVERLKSAGQSAARSVPYP